MKYDLSIEEGIPTNKLFGPKTRPGYLVRLHVQFTEEELAVINKFSLERYVIAKIRTKGFSDIPDSVSEKTLWYFLDMPFRVFTKSLYVNCRAPSTVSNALSREAADGIAASVEQNLVKLKAEIDAHLKPPLKRSVDL